MRRTLRRVPPPLRYAIGAVAGVAAAAIAGALSPTGLPIWAYMLIGFPFGCLGGMAGWLWMGAGRG